MVNGASWFWVILIIAIFILFPFKYSRVFGALCEELSEPLSVERFGVYQFFLYIVIGISIYQSVLLSLVIALIVEHLSVFELHINPGSTYI
jgi:hypothetical protein